MSAGKIHYFANKANTQDQSAISRSHLTWVWPLIPFPTKQIQPRSIQLKRMQKVSKNAGGQETRTENRGYKTEMLPVSQMTGRFMRRTEERSNGRRRGTLKASMVAFSMGKMEGDGFRKRGLERQFGGLLLSLVVTVTVRCPKTHPHQKSVAIRRRANGLFSLIFLLVSDYLKAPASSSVHGPKKGSCQLIYFWGEKNAVGISFLQKRLKRDNKKIAAKGKSLFPNR